MNKKTRSIEIQFPTGVELPPGFERALEALIEMVCEHYKKENPTQVMWVSGGGGKPIGNIYIDDNIEFDMSCWHLEVSAREDLYGSNPWNPDQETLREKHYTKQTKRAKQGHLIKVTDRLPEFGTNEQVLIYTEGHDFAGAQHFVVDADALNENHFESPDDQPEECRLATHWMPLPIS